MIENAVLFLFCSLRLVSSIKEESFCLPSERVSLACSTPRAQSPEPRLRTELADLYGTACSHVSPAPLLADMPRTHNSTTFLVQILQRLDSRTSCREGGGSQPVWSTEVVWGSDCPCAVLQSLLLFYPSSKPNFSNTCCPRWLLLTFLLLWQEAAAFLWASPGRCSSLSLSLALIRPPSSYTACCQSIS